MDNIPIIPTHSRQATPTHLHHTPRVTTMDQGKLGIIVPTLPLCPPQLEAAMNQLAQAMTETEICFVSYGMKLHIELTAATNQELHQHHSSATKPTHQYLAWKEIPEHGLMAHPTNQTPPDP